MLAGPLKKWHCMFKLQLVRLSFRPSVYLKSLDPAVKPLKSTKARLVKLSMSIEGHIANMHAI